MKTFSVATPRIPIAPPHYTCRRAKGRLTLDGRLDKPFWEGIPFTEDFCDISGRDFPAPRFRTRAKLCWDDENLYIAALLEGDEIWANITERDSVMYYDNDFEVFIDPSSSTHNYMELEMNALNTQWDLMLTHPYRDGGRSVTGWNMAGVETAVHVCGEVNAADADNRFWSVEIKIPFKGIMETYSKEENPPELERCYQCRTAPRAGEVWRMNFSRVQWTVDRLNGRFVKRKDCDGSPLPEDNWVWAPTGLIDIHCPEFWSFVFFADGDEEYELPDDEAKKLVLREVYYAEYRYYAANSRFTSDLSELGLCPPFEVRVETTERFFELSCACVGGRVFLRGDGYTYTLTD